MKFTPNHWQELDYFSLVGMFGAYGILHEKMIQLHIYLWTGSSRGQDRTLSILDKEEEP
jgi:hypothetical protein